MSRTGLWGVVEPAALGGFNRNAQSLTFTFMKYLIFNETDGVYAYPHAVSRSEAERIIAERLEGYRRQGYYASVRGRIPVSELSLVLVPVE
jgi:hypothetical protein